MTIVRLLLLGIFCTIIALAYGCSDKKPADNVDAAGVVKTDSVLIQEVLTEVITRWRYRDKAALYDNEFEYIQDKFTYDKYLDEQWIKQLEADSVYELRATKVELLGGDSARVDIVAVLRGTSGREILSPDQFIMYKHRGRWINPTIGQSWQQKEYDSLKRVADSAAEEEAELEAGT